MLSVQVTEHPRLEIAMPAHAASTVPPILPPRRTAAGRAGRALCVAAVAATLGLAACGGSDDSSSDSTDASASTGDSAALTMTVAEFVPLVEADKQAAIEDVVAASPQCEGLHADKDFLITVSVRATDGPQDRPVARLIRDACTP
jgi:hypothetical protein